MLISLGPMTYMAFVSLSHQLLFSYYLCVPGTFTFHGPFQINKKYNSHHFLIVLTLTNNFNFYWLIPWIYCSSWSLPSSFISIIRSYYSSDSPLPKLVSVYNFYETNFLTLLLFFIPLAGNKGFYYFNTDNAVTTFLDTH